MTVNINNHKSLCDIAVKWLKRPNHQKGAACNFAASEVPSGWSGEIPDAIGFRMSGTDRDGSHLVEVKVSRSDFLSDKKKPHRSGEVIGLGNWRYYMCPIDLIKPEELPEKWGLLYVNNQGHVKSIVSPFKTNNYKNQNETLNKMRFASNTEREMFLLVRILSRLGDAEKYNEDLKSARRERDNIARLFDKQKNQLSEQSLIISKLRLELENKDGER